VPPTIWNTGCPFLPHHTGLLPRTQVQESADLAVATVRFSSVKFPPTATVFSPDRDRVFPRPRPCFPPTATVFSPDRDRVGVERIAPWVPFEEGRAGER
jgi:hypothetical protein